MSAMCSHFTPYTKCARWRFFNAANASATLRRYRYKLYALLLGTTADSHEYTLRGHVLVKQHCRVLYVATYAFHSGLTGGGGSCPTYFHEANTEIVVEPMGFAVFRFWGVLLTGLVIESPCALHPYLGYIHEHVSKHRKRHVYTLLRWCRHVYSLSATSNQLGDVKAVQPVSRHLLYT